MTLENIEEPEKLSKEEELAWGKLIKRYPCGCVEREGSRGFCSKHWHGYFAGIKTPENKCAEAPDYIEDDFS